MNLKPGDQIEFMIDKEDRVVLAPIADAKWKKSLRDLAGSMPGLGKDFDFRKEREVWDKKAMQTPLG